MSHQATAPEMHPDEFDGVLRQYFQAELPRTWPAAPTPTAVATLRHGQQSWASTLALVGSLAFLLVLGLAIVRTPSGSPNLAPGQNLNYDNGQANGERIKALMQRHQLNTPQR